MVKSNIAGITRRQGWSLHLYSKAISVQSRLFCMCLLAKEWWLQCPENSRFVAEIEHYFNKLTVFKETFREKYNHFHFISACVFCFLGGLLYVHDWNNLQYVSSAAFLLAVYSDYLSAAKAQLNCPDGQTQPQDLLNFSRSQVSIGVYLIPGWTF